MARTRTAPAVLRPLQLPLVPREQVAFGLFGGWLVLGVVNALLVSALVEVPAGGMGIRVRHLVTELGVHAFLGLLSAAVAWGWAAWSRQRLRETALGLWALAACVSYWLLQDDFSGLAGRTAERVGAPHALVLLGLVAAAGAAVVLAWWSGRRCAIGIFQVLPIAGAVALYYLNCTVSPHDNLGAHALLSWASALLVAPSIGRLPVARALVRRKRLLWAGIGTVFAWGAMALAPRPSNSVLIDMAQWQPTLLPTLLSRGNAYDDDDYDDIEPRNDFFVDRSALPPVPPSEERILPPRKGVVLLLTVDGLRADIVQDDAYAEYIPNIKRLAQEGVTFTQARAPGSQTAYTLSAMSTGKYFSQTYWTEYRDALWPHEDESVHFAEVLRDAKVRTIIVPGAKWFEASYGVLRGFQRGKYLETKHHWTLASNLTKRLLKDLAKFSKRRVFFFVHYLDPHAPYDRAGEKPTLFEGYLAELQLVDEQIGRVLAKIEELGIREHTLVMISSDHGEAFGEHNTYFHAATLYEELIRVPLVVWGAGMEPREVDTPVSLVDIGPTALDIFGLETPGPFMGQSLVPILAGGDREFERPIVAETRLMRAMVFPDNYKVIWDARMRRTEAYDLNLDPKETANLSDLDDPVARQHIRELRAFFRTHTLRRDGYEPPYRK